MESADLLPLLDRLEENVDDLEEVLQPLLGRPLTDTSRKLPVMDRAKLHVLITYTLESLIFSYLRLHGVNAKEHPVFRELTRVKQYFEKIKALETEPEKRTMTLDKQAAGRFIKHGLAGNDKYDLERAEREAKEKALAQLKAKLLAKKNASNEDKPSAEEEGDSSSSESGSDEDETNEDEARDTVGIASSSTAGPPGHKATKGATSSDGKSGNAKAAKSKRQQDKQERKDAQKERRRKKNEKRKARRAAQKG
ncbi:exosome-associated protein, putative [Paecilomyces variotii No. 5]|uniref:Exosome complex protein n=1 Tax=Byssochlamys spectabilis (strain No. 5 / NBRC 109023) TaxID=1356009 RepID=V5F8F0_BYSSN|nr:exosome-associated protein, putative [Paecilomyces variotii No. 5]